MSAAPVPHSDPTFRSYTAAQAAAYAQSRPGYPVQIVDFVLEHHRVTGGELGTLVDVGCGPGHQTRQLAPFFADAVFGADPGVEMINKSRELGGRDAGGKPVQFVLSTAEDIDKIEGLEHGSVDLVTAAMAAHWFDMPKFWAAAARLLKPTGTVAIWTNAESRCHPSMPHAQEVDTIFDELNAAIGPFMLEPNRLARGLYANLVLPWACPETARLFDEARFLRRVWDTNGALSDGNDFFTGSRDVSLQLVAQLAATASPVTRWREAHPELAGTDKDVVQVAVDKIRELLGGEKGKEDQVILKTGAATVILCFKPSAKV